VSTLVELNLTGLQGESKSLPPFLPKLTNFPLDRQYQTSTSLAFASYDGSAQTPVDLPGGDNVAPLGTIYASSSYPGYTPYAAVDGNIGGYPGNSSAEWATNGETNTAWWGVAWDQPYNISSVSSLGSLDVSDCTESSLASDRPLRPTQHLRPNDWIDSHFLRRLDRFRWSSRQRWIRDSCHSPRNSRYANDRSRRHLYLFLDFERRTRRVSSIRRTLRRLLSREQLRRRFRYDYHEWRSC